MIFLGKYKIGTILNEIFDDPTLLKQLCTL